VDFLTAVDAWLPAEAHTVYAIMDNLSMHHGAAVLLFSAAPSPLAVRVSAGGRAVPEPDRAMGEDVAVIGPLRTAVRDVGRRVSGNPCGDIVLERASAPVRVGKTATTATATTGHRAGCAAMTYRNDSAILTRSSRERFSPEHWSMNVNPSDSQESTPLSAASFHCSPVCHAPRIYTAGRPLTCVCCAVFRGNA